MKQNFNVCLDRLLKDEGGYTNDPADAGGPTNFGITLKDYQLYINPNGGANDVRHMTVDQAKSIYKSKYWDALNCDKLESGVDYSCFDYGVNSGVGRPRKVLQQFKTLSGTKLIDAINDERMSFLNALMARKPSQERFRRGWTNRVSGVRAFSKKLAGQKDVATGPVVAAAGGGGLIYTCWNYITAHPYLSTAGIVAAVGLVWWVVHTIRNRK